MQFYVQAGIYSFPTLGENYTSALKTVKDPSLTPGIVPLGFVKIVPNSMFSFEAGALPTMIGAEGAFTVQNMNIFRGLLWNPEPITSKGVQGNFSAGPWAVSLSLNDGYNSNQYTTLSGSVTYTFKNMDTLDFAGSGNTTVNKNDGGAENGTIFNLIYTHTMGPLTLQPYLQYSTVPRIDSIDEAGGSEFGAAILGKYSFNSRDEPGGPHRV